MISDGDMATKNKELTAIQRRKRTVAQKLAEIDRERGALEQEASELAITERTLARLLGLPLPDAEHGEAASNGKSGGKPKAIPSIHQMTVALLHEKGESLAAHEIVTLIKSRWWPSAERNDIAPTLWRLQRMGKLRKDGVRYALPQGAAEFGAELLK